MAIDPGPKKIIEISLSRNVSEINVFLRFTQKFKMTAKNGGKTIFGKKLPDDSADTLVVKNLAEIALSDSVSEINALSCFM